MLTELEALNYLLSLGGSAPVASLSTLHPTAASAQARLNESSITIQKTGWWFNRELCYNLALDTDNELPVPNNTLKVISVYSQMAVVRGDRLYNTYTNNYKWTTDIQVDLIVALTWRELPVSVRDAIKFYAGYQYILHELEDYKKASVIEIDFKRALVAVKAEDLELQRLNIMTTPRIAAARAGVQPYMRGGSYTPAYPGG